MTPDELETIKQIIDQNGLIMSDDADELITEIERAWAEVERLQTENEALKTKETYLGHYTNAKGEMIIITREGGARFID